MSGHGGHETHDDGDTFGKYIGIATALLGLCVVVSTIMSHKAHTASLTHKADASDTWNYYQAKKIRGYESGVAATTLQVLGENNEKAQKAASTFLEAKSKYETESTELKVKAENFDHTSHTEHTKGDSLDLAEGLFELGVILCSLYFLSKKKLFPAMGFTAAALAALAFIWAFAGPAIMPEHGTAHHNTTSAPTKAHPAH